jgi:hypothetical protein
MYSLVCYNELEAMKAMSQFLAYNAVYPDNIDPYGIYIMERCGNVVHFGLKRLVTAVTAAYEDPYMRLTEAGYSVSIHRTETEITNYSRNISSYYADTLIESITAAIDADVIAKRKFVNITYCIDENAAENVAQIYSRFYSENISYYDYYYGSDIQIIIDGTTVYFGTSTGISEACNK